MKSKQNSRATLAPYVACATLILATTPALAQEQVDGGPLAPLKACQALTDATERLACYDKAVNAVVAANEAGDLRVIDREEVQQTRRSLFGFKLPDLGIFGGDKKDKAAEEEIKVLNSTIAKVGQSQRGGYLITTAEGAVWQIDDVPRRLLTPKPGQTIEIRDGALSSYHLSINGQLGVKGFRIR